MVFPWRGGEGAFAIALVYDKNDKKDLLRKKYSISTVDGGCVRTYSL